MATTNLPPTYFSYFTYVDANGYVKPAVGYKLYQYASGTTTNQDTFTSQAGTSANSHPITLDANGACNLWLTPTLEYTFVLKTAAGATVWTRDDVFAAPNAANVVSSVNALTGAVTLTAFDVGYATNSPQSWFVGATVGAALDDIITQVNAEPAANVSVADAGGYYTGATAELALQEVGASLALLAGGRLIGVQVFTGTGTYTKTAGTTSCVVQLVGGGGGSYSVASGGGGGGGGGYACKRVTSIGATEAVTIGAGGAVNGTGGTTSFGSHCSATGGAPGGVTAGGAGGAGSSGDYNLTGSAGGYGGAWAANNYFGHGGSSHFGGGAAGDLNRGAGLNSAANSGGGGSGGSATGGTGGSGLVVIHEYK